MDKPVDQAPRVRLQLHLEFSSVLEISCFSTKQMESSPTTGESCP